MDEIQNQSERASATDLREENERLKAALGELRARLHEPEEIIRAIREGEVDSFVVADPQGERIYSLRNADLLYRSMIEQMREGALALDDTGMVIYCNAYFAGLMRTSREVLIGRSIFGYVPEQSVSFFDALADGWPNGNSSHRELVLRAADGTLVPVLLSMNAIRVEAGTLFCVIVTDMTVERRSQQLVSESRRKDEFLAMLAHELRNPITPIRNALHLLQLGASPEVDAGWARSVIDRQLTQLSHLVDDLLDISRITRGKVHLDLRAIDLAEVIAHAVETAQPTIDARHHTLSVTLPDEPVRVHGDGARLSQVVFNLIHNAAKFTREHGHIWVTLEQDDENARITVRDDGIGIPPEMLSSIFEVFTQADSSVVRSEGGLGLGLALVRNIVEMHEGEVSVHSDGPGHGAEFAVSLPLWSEILQEPARPDLDSEPRPQTQPSRVLVVDDNVDAAQTLAAVLAHLGHEVRTATEGKAVAPIAREFRPHAILLDIGLPDVSGYEVAAELRTLPELGAPCIIALTGYGQEEHRRRSRESGFDHHWVKPVDLHKLQQLLTRLTTG